MAEQYPRVAETRNIAAAICATEERFGDARLDYNDLRLGNLSAGENIKTVVAKWYDPDRGLSCHLRQNIDHTGTQYFLAVYWEDDSYIESAPNECYLLPYAAGGPILATNEHGVPYSDEDYSDRVRELFMTAEEDASWDPNENALFVTTVTEQAIRDQEFREVCEAYELTDLLRRLGHQVAQIHTLESIGDQTRALRELVERTMAATSFRLTREQAADVVQDVRDRHTIGTLAE